MTRILLVLLVSFPLFAQPLVQAAGGTTASLTESISPASGALGSTATLTLTFADSSPSANIAGFEWTLALPGGMTAGAPALGAASTAASKAINCNGVECIILGDGSTLNQTVFASGIIATIPLTLSPTASLGSVQIALDNVIAPNAGGSAVAISTTPISFSIGSVYDLNGDGVGNAANVTIALNEALGITSCAPPFSAVGNGKCDATGVELEVLAALGVIH